MEIYRRHTKECAAKLRAKFSARGIQGSDLSRNIHDHRACNCTIWIGGMDGRGIEQPRHTLRVTDWQYAERIKAEREEESRGFRTGHKLTTVADAVAGWLDSRRIKRRADGTLKEYTACANRLLEWCEGKQIGHLHELSPDQLASYQASWRRVDGGPLRANTFRTWTQQTRSFFLYCTNKRKLLASDPSTVLETPEPTEDDCAASPFTDAEVAAIFAQLTSDDMKWYADSHHQIPPEMLTAIARLMLKTGLRISDAVQFQPRLLERVGQRYVYDAVQQKSKGRVFSILNASLVDEINALTWGSKQYSFWDGEAPLRDVCHSIWYRLRRAGNAAGIARVRPHRFRDTFAVDLFARGASIDLVSKMLGHKSIRITEKHYLPWVPKRKERYVQMYDALTPDTA